MRWSPSKLVVLALVCLFQLAAPVAQAAMRPSDLRKWHLPGNFVGYNGNGELVLVGLIDPDIVRSVQAALDAHRDVNVVYIDSAGGDVPSALDIAALVRNRKLDLVVDGKCLSACANYVFPAAARKTVLPGSLVAIHQLSIWFGHRIPSARAGQAVEMLSVRDAVMRTLTEARIPDYERLRAIEEAERRWYADIGVEPVLNRAYIAYAVRRDARQMALSDPRFNDASCPNLRIWALDKRELAGMGITGIGAFWYPRTHADWQRVAALGTPASQIYHGTAAELDTLCRDHYRLEAFPTAQSFFPGFPFGPRQAAQR